MQAFRMMVCCTLFSLSNFAVSDVNASESSEGYCPVPGVTCIILSECEQC